MTGDFTNDQRVLDIALHQHLPVSVFGGHGVSCWIDRTSENEVTRVTIISQASKVRIAVTA
jgi:hypothetical protein